ncbi:hypothetical protein LY76DRAFT_58351 [Colletotrichum caudatum]|nr:hypothetical protein LY76DRAFT_58351 [Colletotrichum caudatum]
MYIQHLLSKRGRKKKGKCGKFPSMASQQIFGKEHRFRVCWLCTHRTPPSWFSLVGVHLACVSARVRMCCACTPARPRLPSRLFVVMRMRAPLHLGSRLCQLIEHGICGRRGDGGTARDFTAAPAARFPNPVMMPWRCPLRSRGWMKTASRRGQASLRWSSSGDAGP